MSNHFWSQRNREKAAKKHQTHNTTSSTFQKLEHLPRIPVRVWPDGSRPAAQKDNQSVLWKLVKAKLAGESEVAIGLWVSFNPWKLDLDSGRTKKWSMMATQGSSKGRLDATNKGTAQQTNLSPLKHIYWTLIKSVLRRLSCCQSRCCFNHRNEWCFKDKCARTTTTP